MKRLRSLEEENRRLKQIVAQQALDNWPLKELLAKTSEAQGEEDGSDRTTQHRSKIALQTTLR